MFAGVGKDNKIIVKRSEEEGFIKINSDEKIRELEDQVKSLKPDFLPVVTSLQGSLVPIR